MIDPKEKEDFLNTVLRTFKSEFPTSLTSIDFDLIVDKEVDTGAIRLLVYSKHIYDHSRLHIYLKKFGINTLIEPFNFEIGQNYFTGLSGVIYVSSCELNKDQFPSIAKYITSPEFLQQSSSPDHILNEDPTIGDVLVDEGSGLPILLEV